MAQPIITIVTKRPAFAIQKPAMWMLCGALLIATLILPVSPATAQQIGQALDASNSDVVLIIDNSGSMKQNDPQNLRFAAAKLLIDLSDPRDKIGIVVLSDRAHTRSLTKKLVRIGSREEIDELKSLIDAIRNEPRGQETHMGTALELAYDLLDATPGSNRGANQRQFVVLLSDGLPTGVGQRDRVDRAVQRFRERRYWKIFSIALGRDADPAYLDEKVASPSGGQVVVAHHAGELLDRYLEVYARAGDDRYIDYVTVQPNTLAPLIDVRPDHQPIQISVVLVRNNSDTSISSLLAPEEADLVKPYYQNSVRRGAEPEYELYTAMSTSEVSLVGRWMITVDRSDALPTTVAVLSRSRLRIRMPSPAPLRDNEDTSLRYHPVGRPLLLVVGAQVAERNRDQNVTNPYVYRWVAGMTPAAQTLEPFQSPPIVLVDDGRAADQRANDGRYSGLLPPFSAEGDYTLRLELPVAHPNPVHVRKDYIVRVVALPTMTLTLPPAAMTLPINTPLTAWIELPGRADFEILKVIFPTAFVQRPDGVLDGLVIEPVDRGRFRFQYTPVFEGQYRINIAAEVQGRGVMGDIRYIDYTEAVIGVPKAAPIVQISAAFTDTLVYDRRGVLNVPLKIASHSPREERLVITVVAPAGAVTVPAEMLLQPNESIQRTISIRLPEKDRLASGALMLRLTAPEQHVIVQGDTINISYRAPAGLMLPLLLLLVAAGGGGVILYRRRRARRLLAPSAAAPRRLV
ncbi:vWA domain-containing protein [Roseiflexus sp.]|uniref:vWA domain-containing protein n=1 Tax=Roseiflexus sp. TaxID=2562120 RepID=UPI00398AB458